jgi:hypothetical protein
MDLVHAGISAGGPRVSAGDLDPGDIVRWNGRRFYAAAVNLADRVALEPLGPGDRRGGLSGSSTWLQLTDEVEILERFRIGAVDRGVEVDPLRGG